MLVYPNLSSALKPVPHYQDSLPVSVFTFYRIERYSDSEFLPQSIPMLFTQMELNDSVRYLNLPEKAAELLSSRLKEKNLLDKDTKISYFRTRYEEFLLILL